MRPEKRHALLMEALEALIDSAERVCVKYGRDRRTGHPSDWQEWQNLRRDIKLAYQALICMRKTGRC